MRAHLLCFLFLAAACQSGGSDALDAGQSSTPVDAGVSEDPDADVPVQPSCPADFLGTGDGCDCGCGVVDSDCPAPADSADCEHDNCGSEHMIDPSDPSQCIAKPTPVGWTCSAYFYGEDGVCSCGCGALDDVDCDGPLTLDACYEGQNGCGAGLGPNPEDPTQCAPLPSGWTCNWSDYYDDDCDCGCGLLDPSCPPDLHFSQCDSDQCETGYSPNPLDVSQCIDDAPQDDWDCEPAMLLDGVCDCGCGTVDPDCGTDPTSASCDTNNCPVGEELQPDSIAECWEICIPLQDPVGDATCTNGGFFSIFNSCQRNLSACTDGNSYEVECSGGDCVCRVNGNCVAHATGSCSLGFTCGWSLIDAT